MNDWEKVAQIKGEGLGPFPLRRRGRKTRYRMYIKVYRLVLQNNRATLNDAFTKGGTASPLIYSLMCYIRHLAFLAGYVKYCLRCKYRTSQMSPCTRYIQSKATIQSRAILSNNKKWEKMSNTNKCFERSNR